MVTTLKDIAKLAGVSESTASRALNNNSLVSKKTTAKIKKIAKEQNFQFNINARNLASKRTKRIGIIFPDDYYRFNMRDFFSDLQKYLKKYVEEKGYEGVTYTLNRGRMSKSNLNKLINGREVDGLLIACRDIPVEDIETVRKNKIPYSLVYYKPNRYWGDMKFFTNDNVDSGYLATRYLAENGCKKIATITSNDKKQKNYSERSRGYIRGIRDSNLKIEKEYIMKVKINFKSGEELAEKNLELFKKIDGVFCQQDKVALGLMKGLKEKGLMVPEDISIIGHDNMEILEFFDPKLTTVQQPMENICKNSVISLFNDIEGIEKSIRRVFKSSIVERETVRTKF